MQSILPGPLVAAFRAGQLLNRLGWHLEQAWLLAKVAGGAALKHNQQGQQVFGELSRVVRQTVSVDARDGLQKFIRGQADEWRETVFSHFHTQVLEDTNAWMQVELKHSDSFEPVRIGACRIVLFTVSFLVEQIRQRVTSELTAVGRQVLELGGSVDQVCHPIQVHRYMHSPEPPSPPWTPATRPMSPFAPRTGPTVEWLPPEMPLVNLEVSEGAIEPDNDHFADIRHRVVELNPGASLSAAFDKLVRPSNLPSTQAQSRGINLLGHVIEGIETILTGLEDQGTTQGEQPPETLEVRPAAENVRTGPPDDPAPKQADRNNERDSRPQKADLLAPQHADDPLAVSPSSTKESNVFRYDVGSWTVRFGGKWFALRATCGLYYISVLLEKPSKAFSPSELLAAYTRFSKSPDKGKIEQETDDDRVLESCLGSGASDLGEVLDKVGLAAIVKKRREIEKDLQVADHKHETLEKDRLLMQKKTLEDYVLKSLQPNGQSRKLRSKIKRDRDAVRNAMDRTLEKIRLVSPVLYRHLRNTLKIKGRPSYTYEPEHPICWNQ
jgi:hypothetical protein